MSTESRIASGHGIATVTAEGTVLDTWFPNPKLAPLSQNDDAELIAALQSTTGEDADRGVSTQVVSVESDLDAEASSASDVWLRLHLLSHRLVKPRTINLDGIFGHLANVVWTNFGPCAVAGFEITRLKLRARGHVSVYSIDKFPRLVDYVTPSGVRIGDADRVRLGAHLAEGTTVMHEGFVNFNAGTLGTSMVEGRISAGVVVGDGTDIGGGASIMGTLSGGGTARVSIGRRTLLGANAGLGISLGDDCVVEAGLYVTAGTKVSLLGDAASYGIDLAGAGTDAEGRQVVSARALSGLDGLLLRRHSLTGGVEVLPRAARAVELNAALHTQ